MVELLLLINKLEIIINKRTYLLILTNLSSISQNFEYLTSSNSKKSNKEEVHEQFEYNVDYSTINKKDIKQMINHLLDSDKF